MVPEIHFYVFEKFYNPNISKFAYIYSEINLLQVYDNYGHFYHVNPKADRQALLSAQYFFHCACLACRDNWPLYKVSTIAHA
jgi:hypothetical protein